MKHFFEINLVFCYRELNDLVLRALFDSHTSISFSFVSLGTNLTCVTVISPQRNAWMVSGYVCQ